MKMSKLCYDDMLSCKEVVWWGYHVNRYKRREEMVST